MNVFRSLNGNLEGCFYTQDFSHSIVQFISDGNGMLRAEIMLDTANLKVATKTVSLDEAEDLVRYYFLNYEISIDDSYEEGYV